MASKTARYNVDIIQLTKTFDSGKIIACDDINIRIDDDELVVLLGPSGSGKTTALRCIAGLERPDSGKVAIDGLDVTDEPPKTRDIAFVFQETTLFPHLTVRENIRFGLDRKTKLSTEEKKQRVERTAKKLGISEMLERAPDTLSGGQQQRVGLGRAMVMEPDVFLLDEPFSALDANLRDQLQTEIQQLQKAIETSMIFVTHDQNEAMTIGDRIVVMNEGSVQQIGTPYEIYNDPENQFVAEFIGSPSTNIIEGECVVEREEARIKTDLFTFSIPIKSTKLNSFDGSKLSVGLRPEALSLDSSDSQFRATIDIIEPLGDADVVYLETDEHRLSAKTDSSAYSEGQTVQVDFADDDVWLFSPDGDRLSTNTIEPTDRDQQRYS